MVDRRRAWIVSMTVCGLLTGCSGLKREADTGAARVADQVVPTALMRAIDEAGGSDPDGRVAAAATWLTDPRSSTLPGQRGVEWVVRDRDGTTFRVDVYQYTESGAFLPPEQGQAVWGVACRTYDVTDVSRVSIEHVACPAGTPPEP